jgi:hypothetical protein
VTVLNIIALLFAIAALICFALGFGPAASLSAFQWVAIGGVLLSLAVIFLAVPA